MTERPRIVVVMPAFNSSRTLRLTYDELPRGYVDHVILVDDGSTDETLRIARELNLEVFVHGRNYGYGANQKTCYREAIRNGAGIVVMVHPDYQYDPTLLPQLVEPLLRGDVDVVLGSRLMGLSPLKQGMPWWKYVANRVLTKVENLVFGLRLSEYHTGYRAYTREVLEIVNFEMNSDRFVFDQEILAQIVAAKLQIAEVAVPTRYFPEASSAGLWASSRYGLEILWLLVKVLLHKYGFIRQRQLESLSRRYQKLYSR